MYFHITLVLGAIQVATDDLNLAVRSRYVRTEYNRAFESNMLMFSPQINSRFAQLVMFIYRGHSISDSAIAARQLSSMTPVNPGMGINITSNGRTRYNMQENGQFIESVILFFKDVQFDETQMRLVYLPDSSNWTPDWQQQPLHANIHIRAPVLQPYRYVVGNKRQRLDFGY